ncbi:acetyltransferase [Pyrenophora seminiperda CCB06]|uniref:Acetyltransferase n=1 Tax=Pyrenophora seminiperda CCB06 TaxID=1302712 RepID=A0A3M7LYD1_9PLEO|nr:acetyltransferase [Pyrenophora seminiperda CCB06]
MVGGKSKLLSRSSNNKFPMASQASGKPVLTANLENAPTAGNAKLLRCPTDTLRRLRYLHEAEIITLFTPLIPHSPVTTLAKDMDPFEPLGRALPRQVRHVPYRLDYGMTETHGDFLPACGAVAIVICATTNVLSYNTQAFERQLQFARDVVGKSRGNITTADIPIVLLLVADDLRMQAYADATYDFPTLVTINNYTTTALTNAVRVLFG